MRRYAAGDEIETLVFERECFGLGVGGANIRKAALVRFHFYQVEHFLGNVGRPHAPDMRRKGVGDVSTARGDIQRGPVFLRGGECDEPLQALAERMWRAGQVARRRLAELLLDEGFGHGSYSGYACSIALYSPPKKAPHRSMQGFLSAKIGGCVSARSCR